MWLVDFIDIAHSSIAASVMCDRPEPIARGDNHAHMERLIFKNISPKKSIRSYYAHVR